jgi:hypothetical protein
MLLVFDVMLHGSAVAWLAAGITGWFVLWWYLVPLWLRVRRTVASGEISQQLAEKSEQGGKGCGTDR